MKYYISPPKNICKLSAYLEKMNNQKECHIGYCGEKKDEIYDTLASDFSDISLFESFYVAYDGEDIIGTIGFDIDKRNRHAEVWGPFVSRKSEVNLAFDIWKKALPTVQNDVIDCSFFMAKENKMGIHFVEKLGADKKGGHLIYELNKHDIELKSEDIYPVQEYIPTYKDSFIALHQDTFPNSYYDGQQIIDNIGRAENKLYVMEKSGDVLAYVYLETNPEHGEGSIEFLSVCPKHRKKGFGKQMMNDAITQIFMDDAINKITICVDEMNQPALQLYQSLGFVPKYHLVHYVLDVSFCGKNGGNKCIVR